jgi:hypothetical protein
VTQRTAPLCRRENNLRSPGGDLGDGPR